MFQKYHDEREDKANYVSSEPPFEEFCYIGQFSVFDSEQISPCSLILVPRLKKPQQYWVLIWFKIQFLSKGNMHVKIS